MKKLKIDFKTDIITGELIPIDEIRIKIVSVKNKKNKNYYLSEIADFYYKEKYNKNIIEILSKFYEIPRCPATNEFVSYKLAGSIIFGKYSKIHNAKKNGKYIAENDENFKNYIEKIKSERKGSGNPMYGAIPWNKNLTKENDERVKQTSEKLYGRFHTEESKEKQSKSAKKRKIHGHTGCKHSEESKQIMREKTLIRFKNGKFPKTKTFPHLKVKEIINEVFFNDFEEEYLYGNFSFDFRIKNYLIEVQGDYFHCNPNTKYSIPKSNIQIKNFERDKRKRKFVLQKNEFILIEIWEFDIINNFEKVKIWIENLKK